MKRQLPLSFSSQDETDCTIDPAVSAPSEIAYKGRRWLRIDHAPNLAKNSAVSRIWDHGDEYIALEDTNIFAWRCRICANVVLLPRRGTYPALRHLKVVHQLLLGEDDSSSIASVATDSSSAAPGFLQLVTNTKPAVHRFRHHLLHWVVNKQLPFTTVEDDDFRQMLLALSPSIESYMVGKSTIRNWVVEEYERARLQVKEVLAEAKSKIHISFDLWTSPNAYAICAICAHFVGPDYANHSVLLGMKRMLGTHHGEDISEAILPVLEEYKIGPNLGVFVADNADSNDTAIRAMLQVLRPDLNIEDCRSRCLGHILNLAAKAFLFGKETSAFEDAVDLVNENDEAVESDKMKKAQDLWRKKGPVGRFHNIVVFIRSSPQRREAFRRCLVDESNKDLMVMLDNSTRWNSTYSSIKRGLELKERLMLFCQLRKAEISEDILSEADWHHLEEISIALEPFYEATLMSEGRAKTGFYGAVWEVLPTLEGLLGIMEAGRYDLESRKQGKTPLAIAYQNAWEKLSKYYNKTDNSHSIYAAATLLHPSYRKQYYDDTWTGDSIDWKDQMLAKVKAVWEQQYKAQAPTQEQQQKAKPPSFIQKYVQKKVQIQASEDLFTRFISEPSLGLASDTDRDLIGWWMREDNPWGGLRQMALDLLSIPAMSTEVERVFSSAKRLVTADRNRLQDNTIEVLQLLKYWWADALLAKKLGTNTMGVSGIA
jgi:hypothetical protein